MSDTPDIITRHREEEARDKASPARRRRFWMVRYAFDRASNWLVVVSLMGLVGAIIVGAVADNRAEDLVGGGDSFAWEGDVHPESGRRLGFLEANDALRYGRPLYLGDEGRPVVENYATGDIREVTDLELEFPRGEVWAFDVERPASVYTPGPEGLGVWREHGGVTELLPPTVMVDCMTWSDRQRDYLQLALDDVGFALSHRESGDVSVMDHEWGQRVEGITSAIRDKYAHGQVALWNAAPLRWSCDIELEEAVNSGVTEGCPSFQHVEALRGMWGQVGSVNERLWMLSRAFQLDVRKSEWAVGDVGVPEVQLEMVEGLQDAMAALVKKRLELLRVGNAEGVDLVLVSLPEVGG